MSELFKETMSGLLQAVSIEKGEIPMEKIEGMPADTYRFSSEEKALAAYEEAKRGKIYSHDEAWKIVGV